MIKCLVTVIGNRERGDDGIGPLTAERLHGRLPPGAEMTIRHGGLLSLLDDWQSYDAVICVDAAAPAEVPGRIHRIDARSIPLPSTPPPSSHEFGLAEVIALGAALQNLPTTLVVYAIEGACFTPGAAMTQAVADAADRAAGLILQELTILRGL